MTGERDVSQENPASGAKNNLQAAAAAYVPRPALPHGVTVAQQTLNLLV